MGLPDEWMKPKKATGLPQSNGGLNAWFQQQQQKPKPQSNLGTLADALVMAQQQTPLKPLVKLRTVQPLKPVVLLKKPRVFVSFDYENDGFYKKLLEAWNANSKFRFIFQDKTPVEIQSESVSVVKGVLTRKVQEATHVLVLAGKYANQQHADSKQIGHHNWLHFEAHQAMAFKKKVVVVYLTHGNQPPSNLIGYTGVEVAGFTRDGIINALNKA